MEDIMYKDFVFSNIIACIHNWTWQELLVGVEESIITVEMIVEYAKKIINEEISNYEMVLGIIIAERSEEVMELVRNLVEREREEDKQEILDKWCYAMLLELFLKRSEYSDVFKEIASIGADFMHPRDMDSFVYYMPTNGIAMEINWINYLKDQSLRFGIDISL